MLLILAILAKENLNCLLEKRNSQHKNSELASSKQVPGNYLQQHKNEAMSLKVLLLLLVRDYSKAIYKMNELPILW